MEIRKMGQDRRVEKKIQIWFNVLALRWIGFFRPYQNHRVRKTIIVTYENTFFASQVSWSATVLTALWRNKEGKSFEDVGAPWRCCWIMKKMFTSTAAMLLSSVPCEQTYSLVGNTALAFFLDRQHISIVLRTFVTQLLWQRELAFLWVQYSGPYT